LQTLSGLLLGLGILKMEERDFTGAEMLFQESLDLQRRVPSPAGVALCLRHLGTLACHQGNALHSQSMLHESLETHRAAAGTGEARLNAVEEAAILIHLGLAVREQEPEQAISRLREGLGLARDLDGWEHVPLGLETMAAVTAASQPERCARLLGAAENIRSTMGTPPPPSAAAQRASSTAAAQSALGAEKFQTACAEGRVMPVEQAINYAVELSA
jgi:hypothetical protein